MADTLATPEELAALTGDDIPSSQATMLLEAATAVVQEAAGQRIVEVAGDVVLLDGGRQRWLTLPERPVTAVTAVEINGVPVIDWVLRGSRLWRLCGWMGATLYPHQPPEVKVTYDHGYSLIDQKAQLARQAVLSLAQRAWANPTGLSAEQIDDYRVAYANATATLQVDDNLRSALRRQYGRPVGSVALR